MSYNGTAYHGFQKQDNAITIQQVLESALTKLLGEESAAIGCSRTDAGVHARGFCFNLKTAGTIPCDGFVKAMNALLPADIAVLSCEEADPNFHARYSAKSKVYSYLIHNAKIRDVFSQNKACFYPRSLDLQIMREAAKILIGEHDFSAYCKAESLATVLMKPYGAVREIYDITITQNGEYIEILIHGNGFLHNMVRIICGTLINVSEGKIGLNDIMGTKREMVGVTLPAHGLYLNKVVY
jgi:tRNA pseudouridine38-40 synthase